MAAPNTQIIYPKVPQAEEDPNARVNVMIKMINDQILEIAKTKTGAPDRGLLHEIYTARHLSYKWIIQKGWQISRSLTKAEADKGLKGTSQMILVPMENGKYRELDIVYEVQVETSVGKKSVQYIVEAKNTSSPEHKQMQLNVELARHLGGKVVYALPVGNKGQEKAYRDALDKLGLGKDQSILEFLWIERTAAELWDKGSSIPNMLRDMLTDKDMEDEGEDGNGENADWW